MHPSPVQSPVALLPRQAFRNASLLTKRTVSEKSNRRTLMIPWTTNQNQFFLFRVLGTLLFNIVFLYVKRGIWSTGFWSSHNLSYTGGSLYEAFRPGVSNSVSYTGHILTKEGLAGRIKRKNVSAGHHWRLKVPLYCNKCSFINNFSSFNDVAGRVFDTPDIGAPKLFVHVIY